MNGPTFADNAVMEPVIGVIKLANVVTMLELSSSVKLELCLVRNAVFNVVASSLVSALMTAKDCGNTPMRLPSKLLTAVVSSATEEFKTSICTRTWEPRSLARRTRDGWDWGRPTASGRSERVRDKKRMLRSMLQQCRRYWDKQRGSPKRLGLATKESR